MNTKQGTLDAADERIAELEEVKRALVRDVRSLWAERDALREALAGITMIRKLGDGSIAVGPRGWEIAQALLAKELA